MLGGSSSQNLWQKAHMILISIIIFERTCSKLKFYYFANIKAKTPFKMKATHYLDPQLIFIFIACTTKNNRPSHKNYNNLCQIKFAYTLRPKLEILENIKHIKREGHVYIYINKDGKHPQKVRTISKQM
jgi:ribosomal protein L36